MTKSPGACIDPSGITEDDVIAFALGEASGAATNHLARCSSCQTKADDLRQTAAFLQRDAHPPTIKIGELVQGVLTAQEELLLSAHVRTCASCNEERTRFADFLGTDAATAGAASVIGSLRRLLAQPVAPPTAAFSELRGATANDSKAYVADNALIYLNIDRETPARQRKVITGRLERRSGEFDGAVASLFEGNNILVTEAVDDLGYFYFPAVRTGTYRIEVTFADLQVVIEPLEVS